MLLSHVARVNCNLLCHSRLPTFNIFYSGLKMHLTRNGEMFELKLENTKTHIDMDITRWILSTTCFFFCIAIKKKLALNGASFGKKKEDENLKYVRLCQRK